MPKKTLFLGEFTSATASFAKDAVKVPVIKQNAPNKLTKVSCTVRVQTDGYDVTITYACDCKRRQACDGAYKIAALLL